MEAYRAWLAPSDRTDLKFLCMPASKLSTEDGDCGGLRCRTGCRPGMSSEPLIRVTSGTGARHVPVRAVVANYSHGKGGARRRRAAQRPRVLEACQNEAAKGPRHQL